MLLHRLQGKLFRREIEVAQLLGKGVDGILSGLDDEAHGVELPLHELVGVRERGLELGEGSVVGEEALHALHGALPALALEGLVEVLFYERLVGVHGEDQRLRREVVRGRQHAGRVLLGGDVALRDVLHLGEVGQRDVGDVHQEDQHDARDEQHGDVEGVQT